MKPEDVESDVPEVYSNTSPGSQPRRLADHARALDLLLAAEPVGDLPVTAAQLHRDIALVLDADLIGPDILRLRRIGLVGQILRLDGHLYGTGCGCVHGCERFLEPSDMGFSRQKVKSGKVRLEPPAGRR